MNNFNLPLMLFYDNAEHKKKFGMKRGDDNIAMFLKTKLISFSDERYAKGWINEQMAHEEFFLSVSDDLFMKYSDDANLTDKMILNVLKQIQQLSKEDRVICIKAHHSKSTKSLYEEYPDGNYRWKYHYVEFTDKMVKVLSRLFISTIVYNAQGISWPVDSFGNKYLPEGIEVEFNLESHVAQIRQLHIHTSNMIAPFQMYINDILRNIWAEIDNQIEDKENNTVVDFYTDLKFDKSEQWGKWHHISFLDEALNKGMIAPYGVYMLYDSEDKKFYVGKAKNVYERIDQHRKSKSHNEPMKKFDYFRFSLVDKRHIEKLYLIENAAIHDCAAIFNMPNAQTQRLSNISLQGHVTEDLNGIVMANVDESQRKMEKI